MSAGHLKEWGRIRCIKIPLVSGIGWAWKMQFLQNANVEIFVCFHGKATFWEDSC